MFPEKSVSVAQWYKRTPGIDPNSKQLLWVVYILYFVFFLVIFFFGRGGGILKKLFALVVFFSFSFL